MQRRLQALQQHLTAASFDTEKAPHLSMDATAAQSDSIWQQIPQVFSRLSSAIVWGSIVCIAFSLHRNLSYDYES